MRPGNQSNKRMRGRGRKGPNPLSRTYDSNGPDVKIRGTASHIAEKYQQLARDAQASGDRIMSENYFQHAEHYLRIVAAAQAHAQPSAPAGRSDNDENESEATAAAPNERRGRSEQADAGEPVVGENSPQPFVDNMPMIDDEGQVNGRGEGEDGDADGKTRRRVRGTRGRGVRRSDGDAPAGEEAVASAEGDEEAKPRRRPGRPRRPKAETAEPVAAEPVPAGE